MTAPVATEMMLQIKSIDPSAHVELSTYTRQWYVSSSLNISNGAVLVGLAEHRDSPAQAVAAFFDRLTGVQWPREFIVAAALGEPAERREYRWNGAAFQDCTRQVVRDRAKA